MVWFSVTNALFNHINKVSKMLSNIVLTILLNCMTVSIISEISDMKLFPIFFLVIIAKSVLLFNFKLTNTVIINRVGHNR